MRRPASRRLGSAYGVAESRSRLLRLAYLEERVATICAAWLWTTAGFEETVELAGLAEESAAAADALHGRAGELWPATATPDGVAHTDDLAALADRAERAVGQHPREAALAVLLERLRGAYAEHLTATDDLQDAPTARILRALRAGADERLQRLDAAPDLPAPGTGSPPRQSGEPARDGRFLVVSVAEYRVHDMGATPGEIVRHLLYTNAYGELEAVEILGRVLAAAPELPWPMRRALFRQLWDEARHAEASWQRMVELGGPPSPLPPAPPLIMTVCGQISDPLEQLFVLQRVVEGRVVERHRTRVVRLVRDLADPETARLYEYIVADERTHVANAAWVPRVLGDDPARLARLAELQARCEQDLERMLALRDDVTVAPVGAAR